MPERDSRPAAEPPYFQEQVPLGEATLRGDPARLYLGLHHSRERFAARSIVPLTRTTELVTCFHARSYAIEPDITLTVGLYPRPSPVGAVADSLIAGVRRREVGQAQAWYYPADRLLLLRECYLLDPYMDGEATGDAGLATLWRGGERTLLDRCPEAARLVTTWEDSYDRADWQRFLASQGYEHIAPVAFAKSRGARS